MAAATAVAAQLQVPLPPVPVTLQTLVTGLVGLLLPPGEALAAMLVYLGLGLVGLPVFAGFQGGLGPLAGPKGGFLLAFPLQAALVSWVLRRREGREGWWVLASLLPGMVLVYLLGWGGLVVLGGFEAGKALWILVPFLPGAGVKLLGAAALYKALAPRLPEPYRVAGAGREKNF